MYLPIYMTSLLKPTALSEKNDLHDLNAPMNTWAYRFSPRNSNCTDETRRDSS